MAEWPKAPDSKSGLPKGNVGSTPTLSSTLMGTLGGFPNPAALWLRRAKLAFANAVMGTAEEAEEIEKLNIRRVPKPSRALAAASKARLRQRGDGNRGRGEKLNISTYGERVVRSAVLGSLTC